MKTLQKYTLLFFPISMGAKMIAWQQEVTQIFCGPRYLYSFDQNILLCLVIHRYVHNAFKRIFIL